MDEINAMYSDYTEEMWEILSDEINGDAHDGINDIMENHFIENAEYYSWEIDYSKTDDETCAPECCGGWRPIFTVLSGVGCVLAPSPISCGGAAYSWGSMIQDGCFS
jgi:hypothetical protein